VNKVVKLSQAFSTFFNKKAEEISVKVGFIKRKRKLKASSFIKSLIFGHLSQTHCSTDGLRKFLLEDDIDITKQGLEFRFTSPAVEFMQNMYAEALDLFQNKLPLDCAILQKFKSVKLLDSTYISLPNEMAEIYQGYGSSYPGRKGNTESAIKLQLVFDYLNQTISSLDIKEGIRSDQGYRDYLKNIVANDLLVADLGYFVPASFKYIDECGAYFISRYKSDTNLYDIETHQKLDLLGLLKNCSFLTREVYLGKETQIKVRLICHKITAQQAEYRKRKAKNLAKSRGYQSSKKNQELLNWSIFITNVPAERINALQISTVYRTRWQIELLFKLYKSHVYLRELSATIKSNKLLCEFYAKLCILILFHAMTNCIELKKNMEISLTKVILEFKRCARELFLALNTSIQAVKKFLKNIIIIYEKFCFKDKSRKKRKSTLSTLKLLTVKP
jgi:hypothetical protein